ncbi:hypothetical protein D3C76_1237380 [compost metagenome]
MLQATLVIGIDGSIFRLLVYSKCSVIILTLEQLVAFFHGLRQRSNRITAFDFRLDILFLKWFVLFGLFQCLVIAFNRHVICAILYISIPVGDELCHTLFTSKQLEMHLILDFTGRIFCLTIILKRLRIISSRSIFVRRFLMFGHYYDILRHLCSLLGFDKPYSATSNNHRQ